MRRRTFEEMITYFNQTVSEMDIDRKYKMTLLGIVTALLQKHDEDVAQIEPERKKGKWIPVTNGRGGFECDQCHNYAPSYQDGVEWLSGFCPNCGADMREPEDIPMEYFESGGR